MAGPSGPQNAVIGEDYGVDIPVTEVDDKQLTEEKKAAKYSRSSEFKKLKEYLESRITHYQMFLPNGDEITSIPMAERGQAWTEANTIIREFQLVIDGYENAWEIVKEAETK